MKKTRECCLCTDVITDNRKICGSCSECKTIKICIFCRNMFQVIKRTTEREALYFIDGTPCCIDYCNSCLWSFTRWFFLIVGHTTVNVRGPVRESQKQELIKPLEQYIQYVIKKRGHLIKRDKYYVDENFNRVIPFVSTGPYTWRGFHIKSGLFILSPPADISYRSLMKHGFLRSLLPSFPITTPSNWHHSVDMETYDSVFLKSGFDIAANSQVISYWKTIRVLMIGMKKPVHNSKTVVHLHNRKDCLLSMLPKDVINLIIGYVIAEHNSYNK